MQLAYFWIMIKNIITTLIIFLFVFANKACVETEQKTEKESPTITKTPSLNPSGDSELALLMRSMEAEIKSIKTQVEKGETIEIKLDHKKILSAHATEPEKAASNEFKGFASLYLDQIESLKSATPEEAPVQYQSLINTCLTCHKSLCPGPVVRIKKLRLTE